jgi:hypothetical protein
VADMSEIEDEMIGNWLTQKNGMVMTGEEK